MNRLESEAGEPAEERLRNGILSGLIAYTMWGFLPIYFTLVRQVPALEILAHRVIWAVPFGGMIILMRRQWPEVVRAMRHPPTLGLLLVSAIFIAVNWLVYVFAVQHAQIFQASLGYYINPLIYVLAGVVLFAEPLRRMQVMAVVLAAVGVTVLTVSGGQFPLISITLAISFTIYGIVRKYTDVGGMPGLFVETLLLLPLAVGYLGWIESNGEAAFMAGTLGLDAMLLLAGPLTVLPLLFFALAARRLPLSVLGFMQFIAPTLQFLVGVFYGEHLTTAHLVCFLCIWMAVVVFSWDAWHSSRRRPAPAPAA